MSGPLEQVSPTSREQQREQQDQSVLSRVLARLSLINPVSRVADHAVQNPAIKQQFLQEINRANPELAKQAQQYQQIPFTSETHASDKGHGETFSTRQIGGSARGHEATPSTKASRPFIQSEPVVSEQTKGSELARKKTETK